MARHIAEAMELKAGRDAAFIVSSVVGALVGALGSVPVSTVTTVTVVVVFVGFVVCLLRLYVCVCFLPDLL